MKVVSSPLRTVLPPVDLMVAVCVSFTWIVDLPPVTSVDCADTVFSLVSGHQRY